MKHHINRHHVKWIIWTVGFGLLLLTARSPGIDGVANYIQWISAFALVWGAGTAIEKFSEYLKNIRMLHAKLDKLHEHTKTLNDKLDIQHEKISEQHEKILDLHQQLHEEKTKTNSV